MKKYILFLFAISLCLSGCSNADDAGSRADVFNTETAAQTEAATVSESVTGVEATVKDLKTNYEYDGDNVCIPYIYKVYGSDGDIGILVLCDGICTPFRIEEDGEEAIIHTVVCEKDQNTEIPLYFTPLGDKGETVNVEIIDIRDPEYPCAQVTADQLYTDLAQELKGNVRSIGGITIAMKQSGNVDRTKVDTEYHQVKIKEDEKGQYDLGNFGTESIINGENKLLYKVKQGERLSITLKYWGKTYGTIHTAFLIDNALTPTFRGVVYNECPVDAEHFTELEAVIDTSKLSKGRHLCYSICGNIDYMNDAPTKAFVIEVE